VNKKIKIAIIPTIIATYRKGFFDRLIDRDDLEITIFCQRNITGTKIKCISNQYSNNVKYVKHVSTKDGSFTWQFLPFLKIFFDYDVVVISGNPRVISDFFLGILLRLLGKPVILWTMAKSFRANQYTQFLRLTWAKTFKFILTYNENEISFLKRNGFKNQKFIGINNGLDQKIIDSSAKKWNDSKLNEWLSINKLTGKKIILSLARLESKNNFELVLKALPHILYSIPDIHWCLIGEGSQSQHLQNLCKNLNIQNYVSFCGPIFNEDELAPYFLTASVFVHPSAIGLSLLHAYGYGLPVITHGVSDLHGPEYCSFNAGITGLNFELNNHLSLSDTIVGLISDEKNRLLMKANNLDIVRNVYNADVMAKRFIQIIYLALNKI